VNTIKIRVYVGGKLLAEGEVPGPLVAMPAKAPKGKQGKGGER
jgi:hypothetical protein